MDDPVTPAPKRKPGRPRGKTDRPITHGRNAYQTGQCFCDVCRQADRDYRRSPRMKAAQREASARWHARNPDYKPPAQHDIAATIAIQGGVCSICKREPETRWARDHDHATGRVRDMLCLGCNFGLGHFGDDPARLRAAADYVERHRDGPA